jgi:hypothetical protein
VVATSAATPATSAPRANQPSMPSFFGISASFGSGLAARQLPATSHDCAFAHCAIVAQLCTGTSGQS